ncbi:hypothetical protein NKG05_10460 [Oerskovia sp. M15]
MNGAAASAAGTFMSVVRRGFAIEWKGFSWTGSVMRISWRSRAAVLVVGGTAGRLEGRTAALPPGPATLRVSRQSR